MIVGKKTYLCYLISRLREIKEYDELNYRIDNILIQKEFDKSAIKILEDIVATYYQKVIHDLCDDILNKIKNRKTKGQEFSTIKNETNRIKRDSVIISDFGVAEKNIGRLKELNENTDEKIAIEKHEDKKFIWGLIIGFLLGILGGLLVLIATLPP